METGCPAGCGFALQRELGVEEFSRLCNSTKAEILLLQETARFCEICGSVYVICEGKTVLLDRLPPSAEA